MSMEEEIYRLVIKVQGEAEVARLKAELELAEAGLLGLTLALGSADAATLAASRPVRDYTGRVGELKAALAAAEGELASFDAAQRKAEASTEGAAAAARRQADAVAAPGRPAPAAAVAPIPAVAPVAPAPAPAHAVAGRSAREIYEIVVRVEGEDRVAKLRTQLETAEAGLLGLVTALGSADAATLRASGPVQAYTREVGELRAALAAAEGSLARFGGSAATPRAAIDDATRAIEREERGIEKLMAAMGGHERAAVAAGTAATPAGPGGPAGDKVQKIILRVEGEEKARQLSEAIAKEEEQLRRLIATMGKHDAATRASAGSIATMQSALRKVQAEAGLASHKLMAIGGTLDDLQYVGEQGLRPVLNNLMQISPILGIAALAIDQVYRHWDQLMGLMGVGIPQPALTGPELLAANLKKAQTELEELTKKATLAWYEVKRLGELKVQIGGLEKQQEADKAVESALKAPSDEERARGSGFAKALSESGGKVAYDEFKGALEDEKDAKGLVLNPSTGMMGKPEDVARDMVAAALAGDKIARDAIRGKLRGNSQFRENIKEYSPEKKASDAALESANQKEEQDRKADADRLNRDDEEQRKADELADREDRRVADRKAEFDATGAEATGRKHEEDTDKAVAGAKELAPGIDDAIRETLKGMGGSREAESALIGMLVPKFGADAATKLVRDQAGGAREELMADAMKGPEKRSSSVIGAEGLASSIQAAVGKDDTAEKQLQQQIMMANYLRMIANKAPTTGAATFGPNGQLTVGS